MELVKRIILSPGEPAGIGPDLILKVAQERWPAELVVVADPDLLEQRAQLMGLAIRLIPFDLSAQASHEPGTLKIIPITLARPCTPGILAPENASYVLQCLQIATDHCLEQKVNALVTGPIHKGILNIAGIAFTGHTEFLAQASNKKQVLMIFVTPQMKVALVTTHLSLAAVPAAITAETLAQAIYILHDGLTKLFNCAKPKILVCGLNPHAGENGYLGREEIEVIAPVIKQLQLENLDIVGPLSADTIFTEKYLKMADAILAMYHDQALPVVKYAGFDQAVNVTLGLPFIRTSVDHGTALDLAGTLKADAGSLRAAIKLAIELQS